MAGALQENGVFGKRVDEGRCPSALTGLTPGYLGKYESQASLPETSATPPKVVITEFVDVARAFFPEGKEPKFVNAVLDHMAREAKPEAF